MKTKSITWFLAIFFTSISVQALPPGVKHYKERMAAPQFSMTDTEDQVHRLSDYHGQVLVMNFWATWCVPCRKEMPALKQAWIELEKEGIKMLGVATRDKKESVAEFKKNYAVNFPLPMDPEGDVAGSWSVMAVPTAYIVDPDGRVAMRVVGGSEWENTELLKSIIELKKTGSNNKTVSTDR